MKRNSYDDALEQIVAEAKEREKRINKEHPERHGYGMIQGEADDLIRRIRCLERKEDLAQRVKGDRLAQRIKIVNCDKLYSQSPETTALNNIYKQKVNRVEEKFVKELPKKNREIYNMRDQGEKFTNISKVVDIHVSNVSRNYYKSIEKLKEELAKVLGKEREHND